VTDGDANHSCDANILSLFVDGIYCDIAARDIQAGEEVTIDYGLFYSSFQWNYDVQMQLSTLQGRCWIRPFGGAADPGAMAFENFPGRQSHLRRETTIILERR